MKKLFTVVVALAMLLALCVPAFAGDAVNALTEPNAKELATAIEQYVTNNPNVNLADPAARASMVQQVVGSITLSNYGDSLQNSQSIEDAVTAIQTDYIDLLTAADAASLKSELGAAIDEAYGERPGISMFDPSGIGDNIADGFAQNDLAGLFDSMRGAISSLADRLSGVFSGGGNEEDPGDPDDGNNAGETTTTQQVDNEFGGTSANGDTMITSVAAVAAVAAIASAALVLTKKKK